MPSSSVAQLQVVPSTLRCQTMSSPETWATVRTPSSQWAWTSPSHHDSRPSGTQHRTPTSSISNTSTPQRQRRFSGWRRAQVCRWISLTILTGSYRQASLDPDMEPKSTMDSILGSLACPTRAVSMSPAARTLSFPRMALCWGRSIPHRHQWEVSIRALQICHRCRSGTKVCMATACSLSRWQHSQRSSSRSCRAWISSTRTPWRLKW